VRARERRVDRYYDPATDQFLSIDPDVAETGQPYAFTGDDPLNATDPLGCHDLTPAQRAWIAAIERAVENPEEPFLPPAAHGSGLGPVPGHSPLSVQTSVVRGGKNTVESWIRGSEGGLHDGKVLDVSVQAYEGASVKELASKLQTKNGKPYGTTSSSVVFLVVGVGGSIEPDPIENNPYHALVSGITPERGVAFIREQNNPAR
jgi:hypothetical protein